MDDLSPLDWAMRPLKKYATFSGRAPRAEYWWYYLATVIISIPLRLFDSLLGSGALSMIFNLAVFLPWLAVTVRRLHDTDRSGWWLLLFGLAILAFFAVIGLLAGLGASGVVSASTATSFTTLIVGVLAVLAAAVTLLVLMVLPGTEGPNRYGPDPYGPDQLEEVFA